MANEHLLRDAAGHVGNAARQLSGAGHWLSRAARTDGAPFDELESMQRDVNELHAQAVRLGTRLRAQADGNVVAIRRDEGPEAA